MKVRRTVVGGMFNDLSNNPAIQLSAPEICYHRSNLSWFSFPVDISCNLFSIVIPALFKSRAKAVKTVQAGAPEHMLLPSGMPQERTRRIVGCRVERAVPPLAKSVIHNKHNYIMDAGLFMSRSCRVGWGPNSTLVHCGMAVQKQATGANLDFCLSALSD